MANAGNNFYQYEAPRKPSNWKTEEERRFFQALISIFDDIYMKYGRIGEKLLDKSVVAKINGACKYAAQASTTGGVWIDGRPVYRCVVSGEVTANVQKTIAWTSGGAIGQIIRIDGGIWANGTFYPFGGAGSQQMVSVTSSGVTVNSPHAGQVYAIIEYTKQ